MIQLLLVRHGPAEDRALWATTGQGDEFRPLTKAGKRRTERVARGLANWLPAVDRLVSSPYLRAAETAAILARAWSELPVATHPALAPDGDPDAFLDWLRSGRHGTSIAAVGHEPDLGALLAYLLTGRPDSFHSFKKAGAALVEFPGEVAAGGARIVWVVPPRMVGK